MVEKIVWTEEVMWDIDEVLQFWTNNNKNNEFSNKLLVEINYYADLILQIPTIGKLDDKKLYRSKIILKHFYLVYMIRDNCIVFVNFYDVRRNPKSIYINH